MQLRFVLFWRLSTRIEAIRYPLGVKKKRNYKMMEPNSICEIGGERERSLLIMIYCFLMN
jgi:hypothetical protein